jgi:predicted transglutaminase-like cysteine proteinase
VLREDRFIKDDESMPSVFGRKTCRVVPLCLLIAVGMQSLAEISTIIEIGPRLLEEITERYGNRATRRVLNWEQLIAESQDESIEKKLKLVNKFFNRTRYTSDQQHWGIEDYWATPLELLATNGADCEDYSIAKYFTLRALGIPDEDLRLTYVNAIKLGQAHMVLTYYGNNRSNPLVLDNLEPWIRLASERTDLQPVYSFNGGGLWMSRERGRGQLLGKAEDLHQWSSMLTRLPPDFITTSGEAIAAADGS